ncbi:FAD-binding protein [Nocardiopsis coralliicola]
MSAGQAAAEAGWDAEYDFIAVGSGGGGMAAALTAAEQGADALVVEKEPVFGGSTALSGGGIWIPNNPTLRAKGHNDSAESIRAYLDLLTKGRVAPARLDAYIEHGPEAMEQLERSPWLRFFWVKGYADYHPEYEGGRPLGRSVEALPFDTRKLGDDEKHQHPNKIRGPMGLWITAKDYHKLAMVKRTWHGRAMLLVSAWRVASNTVRRRHMATGGRSLIARLRMALKDARVPLWLESPVTELVARDDGTVAGVVVQRNGSPVRVRARQGVLLASGGFEHDQALRDQHLPGRGRPNFSMGATGNTGDGIRLGEGLGAALDFMDDAWWMPAVRHPSGAIIPLVSERAIPRMVIVGADGKRFTNEAAPYVNFVHDQLDGGHIPAWFVMDATARARYPFAQILPGAPIPKGFYDKGTVHRADTLSGLAASIGVDAAGLEATVAQFNAYARDGSDPDFGRGDSAYDRYYGDPTLPNPNLDPVTTAPYYAFRLEAGDLGTKGGLLTDEHARVLRGDGTPVPGLYATGNTSAAVMGDEYAGPGATIGPSIVFGHIAAKHAAAGAAQGSAARGKGGGTAR